MLVSLNDLGGFCVRLLCLLGLVTSKEKYPARCLQNLDFRDAETFLAH